MSLPGQPAGVGHPNFRGGKHVDGSGYVAMTDPAGGGKKREHIMVAERALGKPLPPGAEVHHVNDDKTDNRNSNLVICQDSAYHHLLHCRAKRLREFGRLDVKRCVNCQGVKRLSDFYRDRQRWDGRGARCKPCAVVHRDEWRANNPEKLRAQGRAQAARRRARKAGLL